MFGASWRDMPIMRCSDGAYRITHNGYDGYHVPDDQEFHTWWMEIDAYAQEHPDQVTDEPAPPVPTEAELLARAKTIKTAEFDRAMADIDAELIRSTTDLVAAMLSPATLAEEDAAPGADNLQRSHAIFMSLRQVQERNRALRAQVEAAESIDEVQGIEPVAVDRAALAAAQA